MAEDEEINNVIDFIEHKLLRLEATAAHAGDFALAMAIGDALTRYLEGSVYIVFKEGNPYIMMPSEDPADDPELHEES